MLWYRVVFMLLGIRMVHANSVGLVKRARSDPGRWGHASHPLIRNWRFGSHTERDFDDYGDPEIETLRPMPGAPLYTKLYKFSCTFGNRIDSITTYYEDICRGDGAFVAKHHGGRGGTTTNDLWAVNEMITYIEVYLCKLGKAKGRVCWMRLAVESGRKTIKAGNFPSKSRAITCGSPATNEVDQDHPHVWQPLQAGEGLRYVFGSAGRELESIGFMRGKLEHRPDCF